MVNNCRVTDDEREAISDEALWDFADDLLNSWNIEDQNPPSLAEDFRDRFVARFRRTEVPEPSAEDQGPAASCHLCVGAGGHEGFDGEWVECSCQRPTQDEPSDGPKVVTLEDVYESTGLKALVAEARSEGDWCCEVGCGNGACETCPCCSAGSCVSGVDGVPEDAEAREFWLEVAAEYNPVAAALRAAGGVR